MGAGPTPPRAPPVTRSQTSPTVTAPNTNVTSPGTGTTGTGTTNPGSGPSTTTGTGDNPPALPKPTPDHPLHMLVIGDSLAGDFGQDLYSAGEKTKVIKPAGPVDYHIRPD